MQNRTHKRRRGITREIVALEMGLMTLGESNDGLGGQNVQISDSHSRNRSDVDRFHGLGKRAERVGVIQRQSRLGLRPAAALNNPNITTLYRENQGGYELDRSPIERLREPTHRDAPAL